MREEDKNALLSETRNIMISLLDSALEEVDKELELLEREYVKVLKGQEQEESDQ